MNDVYIDALLVVLAVVIGVTYALWAAPDTYEPLMKFTTTTIGMST